MLLYDAMNKYYNAKKYLHDYISSKLKQKENDKQPGQPTKLDPNVIPKYVNQLPKPAVYQPHIRRKKSTKGTCKTEHFYKIDISEFDQQLLPPGFPKTRVWGYGGLIKDRMTGKVRYSRSTPGATFEAIRGVPVRVKWINRLGGKHLFAVDPTIHWANPNKMPQNPPKPWPPFPPGFLQAQFPVPIVTHLHGGENEPASDGHPEAWFTFNGKRGAAYKTSKYYYPNEQQPATLWYHDHTLGITRLNVYAGLAGFYLLRDKHPTSLEKKLCLPSGRYEIPLVIQDRMFKTDGSLLFDTVGVNPDIHPYWTPEFFGDTIMVNGKVWPNLNVSRRQYRFRILNGSNARVYNLKMSNGMSFIQIGSDGGFLPRPVELTSLLLGPGERADILVNFSHVPPGTKILLLNDANAPFPDGQSPDPNTVGQIMQFTVPEYARKSVNPKELPDKLNKMPIFTPDKERILTLNEVMGPNGPIMVLLNGQMWSAPISETPRVGSTEEWVIANLTADSHPIHLHLVQFQLLNRQFFDVGRYMLAWEKVNGTEPLMHPTHEVPVEPFLLGKPIRPNENELGWKDTVLMHPNQVTRIRVRFAPQDVPTNCVKPGENLFPFDPTAEPGYVWHCHILDHEDNEMMRPYKVKK